MPTKIMRRKNKAPFMNEHLLTCEHNNCNVDLFNADNNFINLNEFSISQIRNITTVIDKANNWNFFFFRKHP